ncbi:hypothetical protein SAMN05421636_1058 [Pricia antarctica]|uniref:Uncharacterized protein n=1 Tax=Pricia antarctica TaxID=641691 RepID=A0A1G7CTW5_9FLAO|nr:hypothetical protein SAMN05421636_1058 [Pricia antarctica]
MLSPYICTKSEILDESSDKPKDELERLNTMRCRGTIFPSIYMLILQEKF